MIVACRLNRTIHARQVVAELDRVYGWRLARDDDPRQHHSWRRRKPPGCRSRPTHPKAEPASDYRLLAEEILGREEVAERSPLGWVSPASAVDALPPGGDLQAPRRLISMRQDELLLTILGVTILINVLLVVVSWLASAEPSILGVAGTRGQQVSQEQDAPRPRLAGQIDHALGRPIGPGRPGGRRACRRGG